MPCLLASQHISFCTAGAGYMEMSESTAEGAARETLEEAAAHVEVIVLLCTTLHLHGTGYNISSPCLKMAHF